MLEYETRATRRRCVRRRHGVSRTKARAADLGVRLRGARALASECLADACERKSREVGTAVVLPSVRLATSWMMRTAA
eukprot:7052319-Heterocapsa_arctica.AAC.1